MGIIHIPLEAEGYYHIYNHAVGKEDIFREEENYEFFLRKYATRIMPFSDLLAYCLMRNHFHFLIRVKSHDELVKLFDSKIKERYHKKENLMPAGYDRLIMDELIVNEFAKLFNSYVQAYNNKYKRRGALLKESFQRKRIENSEYLTRLICYIHNNPVNDGFAGRAEDWKYSSYNAVSSSKKTHVMRGEVLEMFGGRDNFVFMNSKYIEAEIG